MLTFPRRLLLVLICTLGVGSLPSAALARVRQRSGAPSVWTAPQLLGTSRLPKVVFGEVGLAVGMAADGSTLTLWNSHGIHARWRSATGQLGPDQLVAPNVIDDGKVAMAPNGTAVIVWFVNHGAQSEAFARLRSADGQLGPVRDLGSQMDDLLSVAYGPRDGLARFMWAQTSALPHGVFIAPLRDPGGLLAPTPLDDPAQDTDGNVSEAAVAVDAAGASLIVWVNQSLHKVLGRVLSRTGSLGPILTIADAASFVGSYPEVALSPSGTGYVVWREGGGPEANGGWDFATHVFARQVNLSGAMGPTLPIGRMLVDLGNHFFDVATFSDGRGMVAWSQGNAAGITGRILSRTHAGAPFRISSAEGLDPWLVAAGRRAIAVWTDWSKARQQPYGLKSRTISESGGLGAPVVLFPQTGRGQYIRANTVAGNAKGQLVAAWLVQNYKAGGRTRPGVSVLVAGR